MLLLLVGAALALDGNDTLRLTLAGAVEVEGSFLRASPDALLVSPEAGEHIEVPLVLIEAAVVNGEPMGLAELRAEAAEAWQREMALIPDDLRLPSPVGVGAASVVWAGAGHALLGEWRPAAGYAALDAVILGTIGLNVAAEDPRPLPALVALDVLVKIWAAQESARMAKRRREIVQRAEDERARVP